MGRGDSRSSGQRLSPCPCPVANVLLTRRSAKLRASSRHLSVPGGKYQQPEGCIRALVFGSHADQGGNAPLPYCPKILCIVAPTSLTQGLALGVDVVWSQWPSVLGAGDRIAWKWSEDCDSYVTSLADVPCTVCDADRVLRLNRDLLVFFPVAHMDLAYSQLLLYCIKVFSGLLHPARPRSCM